MFITIEGIDGSGKSTQTQILEETIKDIVGWACTLATREPGGWESGQALRDLIIKEHFVHSWTEALLFVADRCEHVTRVILPALHQNKIVLCERYNDSTIAYQVWGRGLPEDEVRRLIKTAGLPEPDITFWLDVDVEKALERISKRGEPDRIESDRELLQRISEGYRSLWKKEPDRIRRIDAEGTMDETARNIKIELDRIKKMLKSTEKTIRKSR
ncbi:MAG: Thymidylate kinase [Synergistales bacterium 53_16]|nr:MAG: Thymidylate kinase [Synergistales bacterium 53_16]KUL04950.1 MAG: Thymidylate kinase [Synergistales bacterium 54_9]MDN5335545.1 dTMP kinase [Synergistales bacterium]